MLERRLFVQTEPVMTSKKPAASPPAKTDSALDSTDSRLDEALEESFPASDPIAVHDPEQQRAPDSKHKASEKKQQ
jgi:hypothetical protein